MPVGIGGSYRFPNFNFDKMRKDQEEARAENQAKSEASLTKTSEQGDAVVQGTGSTEGTGYKNFRDLLKAKQKKEESLLRGASRVVSNFASLLGGNTRLG